VSRPNVEAVRRVLVFHHRRATPRHSSTASPSSARRRGCRRCFVRRRARAYRRRYRAGMTAGPTGGARGENANGEEEMSGLTSHGQLLRTCHAVQLPSGSLLVIGALRRSRWRPGARPETHGYAARRREDFEARSAPQGPFWSSVTKGASPCAASSWRSASMAASPGAPQKVTFAPETSSPRM
jgi:outer membrane receptor protein involved in Fe transport